MILLLCGLYRAAEKKLPSEFLTIHRICMTAEEIAEKLVIDLLHSIGVLVW